MKPVLLLIFGVLWYTPQFCQANCSLGIYENRLPTDAEAKTITKLHNDKRLLIAHGEVPGQPKGINLKKLKWDWALAKAALKIAETCPVHHVPVKDKRWWAVGQSFFTMKRTNNVTAPEWKTAVEEWFNEHELYKYPEKNQKETGHYTQLVWADTSYVGCAHVHFPSNGKFKYQKLYVCHYGIGGNSNSGPPYKTGSSGCENLC